MLTSPQQIFDQVAREARRRTLPLLLDWRLPDRERLGDRPGSRSQQVQPQQLLVSIPHLSMPYTVLTIPHHHRNGRWRSLYVFDISSNSITGSIKVDVHYYEDGNVRLLTTKPVKASASSADLVRQIASAEKKYQEDLNRAFTQLNEGAFKGLRRQLPVTRQKVEWEKISGYRVSCCLTVVMKIAEEYVANFCSWDKILVVEDRGREVQQVCIGELGQKVRKVALDLCAVLPIT